AVVCADITVDRLATNAKIIIKWQTYLFIGMAPVMNFPLLRLTFFLQFGEFWYIRHGRPTES
ncbi:MAG: hypothetical protein QUS14_12450, partial [Pyrinomonadaceae bacterium]|nr:hypothetical protein [Pyrinomonadaceae bacterium]